MARGLWWELTAGLVERRHARLGRVGLLLPELVRRGPWKKHFEMTEEGRWALPTYASSFKVFSVGSG